MLKINIKHAMMAASGKTMLQLDTEVSPHELLCLYGPSGAGKTTLLRMLAGLVKPDFGRIEFNGQVWFDSEKSIHLKPQDRKVGFMFQDYALFPNMTVAGNIGFGQQKKEKEVVEELLGLFDLRLLAERKPHQLSGGQKQRVALARAMASKPALLLLDEPLSALGTEMRLSLREEIRKTHHRLQATTLMVSHDVPEVKSLATSVLMIDNGQLVQSGRPENLHFGMENTEW